MALEGGASVHLANEHGMQPIHFAVCTHDHCTVVQLLVEYGAAVNASDNNGLQPIHYASSNGHTAMVRCLVELGGVVDACDSHGMQPIHEASKMGQIAAVQCLVELGADVDATNIVGGQPIHYASGNGHTATVQCLVELGSVVDMTALQLAIDESHHEVEHALSLPPWRLHYVDLALVHAHVSTTPQPNATYYSIPCCPCPLHGISSVCIACPCT